MKLVLSNVGKINKQAEVEINGITVLAGPNGSGKSTIGKMLFCLFNTFYNYEQQIYQERMKSIRQIIRFYTPYENRTRRLLMPEETISELLELSSREDIVIACEEWIHRYLPNIDEDSAVEELRERLIKTIMADEQEVLTAMLNARFNHEFNNQVRHVNCQSTPSDITLQIKDEYIRVNIAPGENVKILSKIKLVKDIIYIDDPNILDDLDDYYYPSLNISHKNSLLRKLNRRYRTEKSAVDDVIIDGRLKKVEECLESIHLGELLFSNESGYQYKDEYLNEGIALENVSMGLKSYVILKILLEKGLIEDNGILVLDEPEIHLHPEWMRIYAKAVVLLQKEFGLNIVISTHSSDFLGFIELYATQYKCLDKCKFYMLHNEKEKPQFSEIEDVTDRLECIYEMLGKPFIDASEELEKMNET